MSDKPSRNLRRRVYERDGGACVVCDVALTFEGFEAGHLQDRCTGGRASFVNLVVMCSPCNRRKPHHRDRTDALRWIGMIRAGGRPVNPILRPPRIQHRSSWKLGDVARIVTAAGVA